MSNKPLTFSSVSGVIDGGAIASAPLSAQGTPTEPRNAAARVFISLPHWMHCHWMHWQDRNRGPLVRDEGSQVVMGFYVQQERRCEVCNKIQLRVVRTYT